MSNKQKLELTWIGKDKRPKLEPRILLEDPALSYHARQRVSEGDLVDNRLILADNLLALKALEQELTGKVKCCFIDPPYNTGSVFTHYDDGLEHSVRPSGLAPHPGPPPQRGREENGRARCLATRNHERRVR